MPDTLAVRSDPTSSSRVARRPVYASGSEFSLGDFLENLIVDGEISHGSLESSIFSFEFLEAFGLVDPHPTVLLAPAVERLFGDAECLDHLGNGLTLSLQDFGFTQLADDGFAAVSFCCPVQVLQSDKY